MKLGDLPTVPVDDIAIHERDRDLVVATHPLILDPLLRGYGRRERPPLVTVVTDLVTTHAFWYHPEADLCLVPTEEARRRALRNGVAAEKVLVTGLPVATGFRGPRSERTALRAELGWPPDLPVALLVGGGEGMGPLGEIAAAVDAARLGIGLAVVVGRNEKLRARLDTHRWAGPTRIYGFVRNMPALMAAADVLLTKAGPGTVTEALNAGLPMILYGRLPGQEDGNVKLVTDAGAGVWAPSMRAIVSSLKALHRAALKPDGAGKGHIIIMWPWHGRAGHMTMWPSFRPHAHAASDAALPIYERGP